ncbi:MAG: helix-turn-helix domain-containing protein [Candidatus Marinimicrobia bacterium]|nr:helix-turn-helix domain-containing protein [Candidatus Neomarinimicrobiota bacterium]
MFSLIDVLTIVFVVLILALFFFLLQIERFRTKPRLYLKLAMIVTMVVFIIDDLLYSGNPFTVKYLLPIMFWANLAIYPLIYAYSRDLVYNGRDVHRPSLWIYMVLPTMIFFLLAILYYPLDFVDKLRFASFHLSEKVENLPAFTIFQWIVIPAYYLQTIIYVILTLRLIQITRKSFKCSLMEILLAKYIFFYIVAVVFYEGVVVLLALISSWTSNEKKIADMLLTAPIIVLAIYICFKQNLIVLQSRINRISNKLNNHRGPDLKPVISENEKNDIKTVIDEYLSVNQLYLNPDLHISMFANKIHIPARKISLVVNEIYGKNFISLINEYRIVAAMKLIDNSIEDVKINRLFLMVGFNSRSAFNRVFKSINGQTPSEYINRIRQK